MDNTKHYFTEGQRICSSISFGALANTGSTTTPISGTLIALQANAKKNVESTYIMSWNLFPTIITQDFSNKVASGIWDTNGLQLPPSVNNSPASADAQFYYLSDHLGSSSYITNNIGNVTQTLAYLPFGEDWVNINNSTPYPPMTPYKFNGKEKDEETGFNYYGARYYWDWLPQFISIDPMSDKYPHLSPYVYCANNPVKYIDPNGMEVDDPPYTYQQAGVLLGLVMEKFGYFSSVKQAGYYAQSSNNANLIGVYRAGANNISTYAGDFTINITRAAGLSNGKEGDAGNAIRHTLWQAMITTKLGANAASKAGNAHETGFGVDVSKRSFGDLSEADKTADALNNIIGMNIGDKNKGASNKDLAKKVMGEYKDNGLWTVSKNKSGYTIQKTKISQEHYNKAINEINRKGDNGLNQ